MLCLFDLRIPLSEKTVLRALVVVAVPDTAASTIARRRVPGPMQVSRTGFSGFICLFVLKFYNYILILDAVVRQHGILMAALFERRAFAGTDE